MSRGLAPQLRSTTTTSCFLRQTQNRCPRPASNRTKLAIRGPFPLQRDERPWLSRHAVGVGTRRFGRGAVVRRGNKKRSTQSAEVFLADSVASALTVGDPNLYVAILFSMTVSLNNRARSDALLAAAYRRST